VPLKKTWSEVVISHIILASFLSFAWFCLQYIHFYSQSLVCVIVRRS